MTYTNKSIGIFGAGIAGLTVADELSKRGFNVYLFEKQNDIGGLARSLKGNTDIPVEVSWRGIAPFYHNMIKKLSEIPYKDRNVFDYGLIEPMNFVITGKDENKLIKISDNIGILDNIVLARLLLRFKSSSYETRLEWAPINASEYLKKELSHSGWYVLTNSLGAFTGVDKVRCSMYQFLTFYVLVVFSDNKNIYRNEVSGWDLRACTIALLGPKGCARWSLFSGSSKDVFFEPWRKKLESQNTKIYTNHELISIKRNNRKITSVNIKNNKHSCKVGKNCAGNLITTKFDYYVFGLSPFGMIDVLKKSQMPVLLDNHLKLTSDGIHYQIPFTIMFNEEIHMPRDAYIFGESPYNIVLYFQSDTWKEGPTVPNTRNSRCFWSGTACVGNIPGTIYKKPLEMLTKDEFFAEISIQIESSVIFQKIIMANNNGKSLTYFLQNSTWATWPTFKFAKKNKIRTPNKIATPEPKWVPTTTNELFRPHARTNLENCILTGAHIVTTVAIYSMEGAVESGLMAANVIIEKHKGLELCEVCDHK